MNTSDTGDFRRRQAVADLRHQMRIFPAATVRRIGAGIGIRTAGTRDLQKRLEWFFQGKAPLAGLRRDRVVFGSILMASALPDEDFEPFIAATAILLIERLVSENGPDDGFWNWKRLAPHYRLAQDATRSAVMCGFREARLLGRVSREGGPSNEDCLTAPREAVLADLAIGARSCPILVNIEEAILTDLDAHRAGALWAADHRKVATLSDNPRRIAEAGFRYLYERPLSLDPPPGARPPVIPVHD